MQMGSCWRIETDLRHFFNTLIKRVFDMGPKGCVEQIFF